jgi:hypothetical protein
VDVKLPGPSNATHTFYFIVGGNLASRQQFVMPQPAANIGIKVFYADPREGPPILDDETRQTTLHLTLWNDGLTPGTANVRIVAEKKVLLETNVTVQGFSDCAITCKWSVKKSGEHLATASISGNDTNRYEKYTSTRFIVRYTDMAFWPTSIDLSGLAIPCLTMIIIAVISLIAIYIGSKIILKRT